MSALTLEAAARIVREATKDKSYRATPLGLEVARYIRWKRSEWGATETTVRDYEAILAKTALFFADLGVPAFEPPEGVELLRELWDAKWGEAENRTRGKVLSVWRDFFKWACKQSDTDGNRILKANPALELSRPKTRDVKREIFTDAFVLKAIAGQDYLGDKLGVTLILKYALRKAELRGVQFRDFDFERRRVFVTGKGGAVRYVPIKPDEAFWRDLGALELEIQAKPDHFLLYKSTGNNGSFLTPLKHDHTEEIGSTTAHSWWYRCLHRAGLVDGRRDEGHWNGQSMHRGRHTVATEILRGSGNIVAAQKMLGHADSSTTERAYAHFDDSDLARVLERIRVPAVVSPSAWDEIRAVIASTSPHLLPLLDEILGDT